MRTSDAITLKQLRALVAVAECAGVSAAAERLRLTAPAVSMQLKALESQLGVELVDRETWRPNACGRELIDMAQRVDALIVSGVNRVAALTSGKAGHVVLGVTSTGKYFAPFLIARIFAAMPELDVSLVIGNREAVLDGLAHGRIDVAITGRPPRTPHVEATVLGDHPHVWIAAPDHPMAAAKTVETAHLLDDALLIREQGSGTRILMERLLARDGEVRPARTFEFSSNETIKQAVMAGLGIAFLSGHTVTAELADGRLVVLAVPGTPVVRQWFLVRPSGTAATGALSRVVDFVVSLDGAFLPKLEPVRPTPAGPTAAAGHEERAFGEEWT